MARNHQLSLLAVLALISVVFVASTSAEGQRLSFGHHIKPAGLLLDFSSGLFLSEGQAIHATTYRESINKLQHFDAQLSGDGVFQSEISNKVSRYMTVLSLLALSALCYSKNHKTLAVIFLLLAVSYLFIESSDAEEMKKKKGKGKGKGGKGKGKATKCTVVKTKKGNKKVCSTTVTNGNGATINMQTSDSGEVTLTVAKCTNPAGCTLTYTASANTKSTTSVTLVNNFGPITNDPSVPITYTAGVTIQLQSSQSITLTNISPNPALPYTLIANAPTIFLQYNYGTFVGTFDTNCQQPSPGTCQPSILGTVENVVTGAPTTKNSITNTQTTGDTIFGQSPALAKLAVTGGKVTVDFGTAPTATATVTPTVTPTSTVTPTKTPTISVTRSITPTISTTPSITPTISLTPSVTRTPTPTPSVTRTPSVTPSATRSITPTRSASRTPSVTPSETRTITPTRSASRTPSVTPSETRSITPTRSATRSATVTPTETRTPSVTPSVTRSITPSRSPSRTPSVTPSETRTLTPSRSPSRTPSVTPSETRTITPSRSPSRTTSVTPSETRTITPTPTPSRTVTITPTETRTITPTPSVTPTTSLTPTNSRTPTLSPTNSRTPSLTPTSSRSPTRSVTPTRSITPTPSLTPSETRTPTPSRTVTITPSVTPSESRTPTPSRTVTPSVTPSRTVTITPTVTPTNSRTVTPSRTVTVTPSVTPSESRTITPTPTNSRTPTPSRTVTVTPSVTPTETRTITPTPTNSRTVTPSVTVTRSPTPSRTVTVTPSVTPSETRTITPTPTSSRTVTPSRTVTVTPSVTPTETRTITPSASVTRTASLSPTTSRTPTSSITPSRSQTPSITLTRSITPSVTPSPLLICPDLGFTATNNFTDFNLNYPIWKSKYVTSSGAPVGLRVVDFTDCSYPSRTISEGIAYGMILSAFYNDSTTFSGLWTYAKYYFNNKGCMVYLIDSTGQILDPNCAPDADQDMAYALLIASVNFGVTTYYTEGIAVANAMFNNSVKSNTLVPFPPFTPNPLSILNPSYFAPGYYDMFNARDTTGNRWDLLQSSSYTVLNNNGPHVVRDWSNSTGGAIDPTLSQSTVCTVFPSLTLLVDQWPWRIRPDPFNNIGSRMSFFFTGVTVGDPTIVKADCGDGAGYRTLNLTTFDDGNGIIKMWSGSASLNCKSYVNLDVTNGATHVYYQYFYWIGSFCDGVQDGFNGYYSFDAVRMPWRTAFDAAYLGNSQSKTRCQNLMNTGGPFATLATIDGQKFVPSGNSVVGTFTGSIFRAPAVVCSTIFTTGPAVRAAQLADLSGNLKDGTYFGDTIQLLMQLFVSGQMNNATCALIRSFITPISWAQIGTGTGATVSTAPTAVCYRNTTNFNYVSFTAAVEFATPLRTFKQVEIDCGNGFQTASKPNPDPFNTYYITSSCVNGASVQVRLTLGDNYVGTTQFTSTVTQSCPKTTFPSFCWRVPSQRYYLQAQIFQDPATLQISCADYSTSIGSRGLRDFAASGSTYPFLHDTNGLSPGVSCSPSGSTLLVYNDTSNGARYAYLTNWRRDIGVTNELCPNVTATALSATGTEGLFCVRPVSNGGFIQIRVDSAQATLVQYNCTGGTKTATYDSANQVWIISGDVDCQNNYPTVALSFNGGALTTYNVLTKLCPDACFQNTSNAYYVGVNFEYIQLNATISQPSSICRYPGPLNMVAQGSPAYSYGTPNDLKGLDYCLTATPVNTTITFSDSTYNFQKTLTGDYRDPALQCIS